MTVYLSKVWGFDVPCGPLQFSLEGWRDRARGMLRADDTVVVVGTLGDQTDPSDQGRLLGLMEPTNQPALSLDFRLQTKPHHFDAEGNYRWPFALLNRRAWRFSKPRKLLSDVSSRRFNMDAAAGIVPLTEQETSAVMQLPKEEVPLLVPVRVRARAEGDEVARKRAAPPPSTMRQGIMHMRKAPAYTYAMFIDGAMHPAFKIGWTFDFRARQRQFNLASLPAIGGLQYVIKLVHLWDTATQAFRMEQILLKEYDELRHPSNREVLCGLTIDKLERSWQKFIERAANRH